MASTRASTAVCSRLPAQAQHKMQNAAPASPGANPGRAARCKQAAAMAAHRQAPRGVPMWSLWMPSPTSTASAAEHSRLAVSAGLAPPTRVTSPCSNSRTPTPQAAPGKKPVWPSWRLTMRAVSAPMQAPASFKAVSSGWNNSSPARQPSAAAGAYVLPQPSSRPRPKGAAPP